MPLPSLGPSRQKTLLTAPNSGARSLSNPPPHSDFGPNSLTPQFDPPDPLELAAGLDTMAVHWSHKYCWSAHNRQHGLKNTTSPLHACVNVHVSRAPELMLPGGDVEFEDKTQKQRNVAHIAMISTTQ